MQCSESCYSISSSAAVDSPIGTGDAERVRCLEIDGQLEFGRLLDRQIGGLFAFKDTPDVPACVMADKPRRKL